MDFVSLEAVYVLETMLWRGYFSGEKASKKEISNRLLVSTFE